ncbi:MAG: hypothetical protein IPF71_19400, partial [Rhodoferax sp.]|nr:hypothetical protein [Rhodoferax sp.]
RTPVTANGKPVGTMSAVVFSPRLGRTIGLGQIDRLTVESGAKLEVHSPNGLQGAVTAKLPFI